jgi:hypothetical protein
MHTKYISTVMFIPKNEKEKKLEKVASDEFLLFVKNPFQFCQFHFL